jgi:hypothetical protein
MNSDNSTNDQQSRRSRRSSGSFWFPVALIVMGVIFLLQQMTDFKLYNWWALFILIPALSAFGGAFALWQRSGRFSFAVWSTFFGGLFPLAVALIFLLDLPWSNYWPVMVILGGISMMNSGFIGSKPQEVKISKSLLSHRPWSFFIGLGGTLLGVGFLGKTLGFFDPVAMLNLENWWAVTIMVAGLGGLVTAALLLGGGRSVILALINLVAGILVGFVGFVAIKELDWELLNLIFPILLILAGLGVIVGFGARRKQEE